MKFSYVDIKTKGCEGWLNLFFEDHCIAMIDNVFLANRIRLATPAQHNQPVEPSYCPVKADPKRRCSLCKGTGQMTESHDVEKYYQD